VGGFHHNATGELLARWTQLGAFTPFFRNHSDNGTLSQEPWAFGERVESICRRYINLRYQLLAYWTSLFTEAHRRGTPIIRPLFWHYPNDPTAVAASDQFLLGPDLMVAPILKQGATARSVYLPVGTWFDFWTGAELRGGQHVVAEAPLEILPLYARAGAIVPMVPVQPCVGPTPKKVHLHVWSGTDGQLSWYEDDGVSLAYLQGVFHERQITLSAVRRTRTHHLSFSAPAGSYRSAVKRWRVILRSAARPVRVKADGKRVPAGFVEELGICVFELPNRVEGFELEWK
jgi:alpha-glucosidase